MLIYQVLPRLWGKGRFSDWDRETFEYLKTLGITHIWFTGVPRHASGKPFVKGNPGCPYSISDWFDTNPYLADSVDDRMDEFEALVRRTHRSGLKVITDYIPNHVSADCICGIPVCGWHDYDWTDTLKVDWSDPLTLERMIDVLRFWAGKGVDGFRCDMVELVPCDAMKAIISTIRREFPLTVFIAEVYNRENYRRYIEYVGFDLLYDKSGAYDTLMQVKNGQDIHLLSRNWQLLGDLQPRMLNFLENHDERRLDRPDYAALAYAALFNRASFMLYFAGEIGENAGDADNRRTSIFDIVSIPSVRRLVAYIHGEGDLDSFELETLQRHRSILGAAARMQDWDNYDLLYCNDARVFPFLRYNGRECCLVVCNFSDNDVDTVVNIPDEAQKRCRPLDGGGIFVRVKAHDCVLLPV